MSDKSSKTFNLNFETVGSIMAMVIGVIALFVAWDQAQVMRKQQHASVWPLLAADFFLDADKDSLFLELTIANEGVGPAIVESAFLTLNGERVSSGPVLMSRIFPNGAPKGSANFVGSDIENTIIGAGGSTQVFRVAWTQTEENIAVFRELGTRYFTNNDMNVSVTVCYCSVFDRCYVATGDGRPERADQCPAPTGFFSTILQTTQASSQ
ncbi:hypothetical protein MNBD_ALPHA05-2498 [hydrothermal vent metagenome]|uniref:Uncharacterized protein n=1 Tax=hydrothermal vent metagenome TaxID=652676 RepID=A0A3B0RQQ7_9ZZZZ